MVRLHIHTVSQGDKTVLFFFVCTLNQIELCLQKEIKRNLRAYSMC